MNLLDKEKFEVWYLSYSGAPKDWYKVDKFFNKVPYDEVGEIYSQCDILIKSSLLESFSYPPLEMMATGGIAIVAPNAGNVEYLKHEENCMLYEQGNIEGAYQMINEVCNNDNLRTRLITKGVETVNSRIWDNICCDVLTLYGYEDIPEESYGDIYEKTKIL
ncbi:Glycosyl transferases group 1 [compost metagenome]